MKRIILFAAAGLMGLAACTQLDGPQNLAGEGALLISVNSGAGIDTKAADVNPAGKDADLHDIQLFLFSSDGSLYRREALSGTETSRTLDRVKTGSYDIVAVANAPALTATSSSPSAPSSTSTSATAPASTSLNSTPATKPREFRTQISRITRIRLARGSICRVAK